MPYSGIGDESLPKAVTRLPKRLREIWVEVFNETFERHPDDEGRAHRAAWVAVRRAQEEKEKMMSRQKWDWRQTLARLGGQLAAGEEAQAAAGETTMPADGQDAEKAVDVAAMQEGEMGRSGDAEKATKTDGGQEYGASAYLVVPDAGKPSEWKLRIEESPGEVTVAQLGRAAAALGPGFRGRKVQLDEEQKQAAARKLIALYRKNDVADEDIPEYLFGIAGKEEDEETGRRGDAETQAESTRHGNEEGETRRGREGEKEAVNPQSDEELIPAELWQGKAVTGLKTVRQADGRLRWVSVSSGGFEDRDREVVSTEFLASAVQMADKSGDRGPLLIGHIPGANVGSCDMQMVVGEPGFLLESGLFDESEAGRRAAAYYGEHAKEQGVSIKFFYVNRTQDGVYLAPGMIVERSVMPASWAAFPWSAINLQEVADMAKGLSAEKRAELERVLGADLAESIVAQLELNAESLKELGVRFKESSDAGREYSAETGGGSPRVLGGDTETVVETATDVAPEAKTVAEKETAAEALEVVQGEMLESQPLELVLTPEALAAVAEKAMAGLDEKLAPVTQGLETLRAALAKMAADVEQMKRSEDERIAEKVRNLPRATVKAMTPVQMMRPSQRPTEEKDAADEPRTNFQELGKKALYGE